MKLYTFDPAPNPQRLNMFINYKRIDIDTTQVNFQEGEQRTATYKKVVPTGTVPALLLDSGRVLSSVFAITQYLEALHPDRPLLGTTNEDRALILDWNHRIFNDVFKAIADLFRNTSPAFVGRAIPGPLDTEQIPALADRGRSQLSHALAMMNEELTSRDFVAGDAFSMADIDLLASLHFAGWAAKVQPDESLTALLEWRERAQAAIG